jgi:hypothetical protein
MELTASASQEIKYIMMENVKHWQMGDRQLSAEYSRVQAWESQVKLERRD